MENTMKNLNEAIINLINEDVVNGKKAIHAELYGRIGNMLEEKLVEFAPTIFNEATKKPLSPKQKKYMDKDSDGDIDGEDLSNLRNEGVGSDDENLILEEFDILAEELQNLVSEIEEELGEELNESEIEDLADMLLESLEEDPDEEEDLEDEDEDFEEDFEDEDQE
jgi:hypothetical protein